jgi:peptide/nickel transport system substrate-binding protein
MARRAFWLRVLTAFSMVAVLMIASGPADAQKKGGVLRVGNLGEPPSLDAHWTTASITETLTNHIYEGLFSLDRDNKPIPMLAESYTVSKDGLTYTFKLRQGVKFHDGQELTSADVRFTFDRLFEKSPGKSDFIAVDKVEPAGKYTVKFITKEPFAGLLAALGGFWGFIINEAGVKSSGGDLNKAAVGTGPFTFVDWKVEQQLVLKRNPNYFRKGLPHVDELIVRTIPDESNIVAALRTGQIQHAFIEDNKNYSLLKEEKSLTGYRSSRLGYDYLNISANRGPLKDVRVRQAISWAVDRSQVLRVAAAGFGRLTAPATAPMKQWQLPEEVWMKYYKPDVEKAKKLMAEAGQSAGFTVKCLVIPTFPTMVAGAPVIANQLKRIGITMEIENVEYAIWIKRWLAHDFDMTMNSTPGYADPDTAFFRALHSTKGQNWNSWSVPELDALLEEGRRTLDFKKRKEIYDRVQIMILENVPHLWLFSADTIDFTQSSVKGFKQHPMALLYGFEGAWIDKA